jgi:acyl carrier protein
VWRIFKTAHCKVADFRRGRDRQSDERFVAECELPDDPDAARIAIGVRRVVASVGLIDPLFIRASDRFPEELGILPLWDSMDWLSLMLELEEELGRWPRESIGEWEQQHAFSVKQLVQAVYEHLAQKSS